MPSSISTIYTGELDGIDARLVEVEVDLHVGLHTFTIVGLADKAIGEAKERVGSALKNSGFKPPSRENRKIVVNLAPADLQKAGTHYDLAIAVGYLTATSQITKVDTRRTLLIGELALDGRLRSVPGILCMTHMAQTLGFARIIVPQENTNEAMAIGGIQVLGCETFCDAVSAITGTLVHDPVVRGDTSVADKADGASYALHSCEQAWCAPSSPPDLSYIKGQEYAKRALTIAAAGGHNLLMIGPPGVGKSALASTLPGILPALTEDESIEITKIHSAAGEHLTGLIKERPFRSPHQTASLASVIGGGTNPRPGEISLAHRGVLFLDELLEFPRHILEALRSPMEDGVVSVARVKRTVRYPAKFSLIAAMNPCPCGFYGDVEKECRCSAMEILRYQRKISGPLFDRIDLQVTLARVPLATLREQENAPQESKNVRVLIENARAVARARFHLTSAATNAEVSSKDAYRVAAPDNDAKKFLETIGSTRLSPRGYYRLLKTSRTIADLENSKCVSSAHLAEALGYRVREQNDINT